MRIDFDTIFTIELSLKTPLKEIVHTVPILRFLKIASSFGVLFLMIAV